jgi:hypothetical protein
MAYSYDCSYHGKRRLYSRFGYLNTELITSHPSTSPSVLHEVISEYEKLLRSLMPKLNEEDKARVQEKVELSNFVTQKQLDEKITETRKHGQLSPTTGPVDGGADNDNQTSENLSEEFLGASSDISFLRLTLQIVNTDG